MLERSVEKLTNFAETIDGRVKSLEDAILEMEERAAKARHGGEGRAVVTDNLKAAIPERMRESVETAERMGAKDPVSMAAKEAWLKNHLKMQMPSFGPMHGQLAEENRRLAQAMGESRAYLNENTGSMGEYGVPSYVEADIYRVISEAGLVRRISRSIFLRGKSSTAVNVASNVTSYVVSELGSDITSGEPTFGSAVLNVRDFVAYGEASIDVLEDEAIGLLNFFAVSAGEEIGRQEDQLALEGTSGALIVGLGAQTTTSTYTIGKIIRIDTTSATNSPTTPTIANLTKARYSPRKGARVNSAWFAHPMTWAAIIGQTSSSLPTFGQAAWFASPNPSDAFAEGTLLGAPVYVTDVIASATEGVKLYHGNFGSQMVFGDRSGIRFDVSMDHQFKKGLVAMRVIKRTGVVVANAHGFSYIAKCPYSV